MKDKDLLQVYNQSFKEIFVNLPPGLATQHRPPTLPAQKATHVCGEYKDLLRTLSKDWNSTTIRLCKACSAWRPLGEQYWESRAHVISLDRYRIATWTRCRDWPYGLEWMQDVDCTCPECDLGCRLLASDIDGVSEMISGGVITG